MDMSKEEEVKIRTAAIFKYGLSVGATNTAVKHIAALCATHGCPRATYRALDIVWKDMGLPSSIQAEYENVIRMDWVVAISIAAVCVSRGWTQGRQILNNLKRAYNNQYGRPKHTPLYPFGPVYDASITTPKRTV